MQLIGMLDSPYVRRVTVSFGLLGLPFEHRPVSVFRHFDEFRRINPVVKAPSLVCDDGTVLMDSSLILEYAESFPARRRSLVPADAAGLLHDLYIVGLALAACEKSVQLVYERQLRPAEKLHMPWVERISGQLLAACTGLDAAYAAHPVQVASETLTRGDVASAVAWHFIQAMVPETVPAGDFPALQNLSARAERLPAFRAAPHGEGTVQPAE
ncbi:glutathione S-transferase family protein [Pseudothauera rhizosphaerae]|uniref:Glutathione S-transferase n=1 Tax=Pseudothauera rhizosphaerae TaxID=2565932 RepID=A0A4S4ASS3_9RHOO|nr:glutathione S-transferase [Pseudothauera rhizosphaerae]THF62218.1 glutathione S-transferase [Pseudothauera rhizosphaerae]